MRYVAVLAGLEFTLSIACIEICEEGRGRERISTLCIVGVVTYIYMPDLMVLYNNIYLPYRSSVGSYEEKKQSLH